ncbi:TatD family hydrolase [Auritidibacter sp. NML130574]|uniref:TatD family hydrolase n=1 Tax=Auritidibacter sp. NML130574 TaxID=2170745 RepID=UPI001FED8A4C|nr:TatD family hydrolase [Auritidibacter sp. NML130574]
MIGVGGGSDLPLSVLTRGKEMMSSKKSKKYDQTGVPEAYRVHWPDPARPGVIDTVSEGDGPRRDTVDEYTGKQRVLVYPKAPEPLVSPIIDNHAHLDFRDGLVEVSIADALDTAESVGVAGVIQVGCDLDSARFTLESIETHQRLLGAVALHPNEAAEIWDQQGQAGLERAIEAIAEMARHPRVRAVGETGLDYYRTGAKGHEAQQYSFRKHVELAVQLGKAVQIHDREAHEDVVEILLSMPQRPEHVVFHAFSAGPELADICNEHGWYMSFSGPVTFNANDRLREAAALARPELILTETDSPFLTPHPRRGRPNAPYMTPLTLRKIAEVRGTGEQQMCEQVMANTRRVYGDFS